MFDNLFRQADVEDEEGNKSNEALFGEITGDGMIIDESQVVSQDIINDIVDLESEEVQNSIIVKTMRCQVSDILGS